MNYHVFLFGEKQSKILFFFSRIDLNAWTMNANYLDSISTFE